MDCFLLTWRSVHAWAEFPSTPLCGEIFCSGLDENGDGLPIEHVVVIANL